MSTTGFPRHSDVELNLDLIETIRADNSTGSTPIRTTVLESSWVFQGDHINISPPGTPDEYTKTKLSMNGGFTCAIHSPVPPPPPKPPRYKKSHEANGPLCASLIARVGAQRLIVGGITILVLGLLLAIGLPFALDLRASRLLEARLQVVRRILNDAPLVDGHNDLAWNIRKRTQNKLRDFRFNQDLREDVTWSSVGSQTDLPRLQKGLIAAQFFSAYVPCGTQYLDSVQLTLEQIDVITRLIEKYPKQMQFVISADGLESARRQGRIASLIGVEGGHSLGSSLGVLRTFYQLGARYVTLTHSCNTPWADSSLVDDSSLGGHHNSLIDEEDLIKPLPSISGHNGLSDFGKVIIQEMNRLGMMIDLSHVSVATMESVLRVTRSPIIFSHSAAHALCNSSRNVPDHILSRMAMNGGIVMISFFNEFLTCKSHATLQDVIAHINHIRNMAGINHIGLGAGFDGISEVPDGLEDVSKYPLLLAELARDRRWSAEDIKKLVGANLVRVMRENERIRNEWEKAQVEPYEEWISLEDLDGKTYCRYPDL